MQRFLNNQRGLTILETVIVLVIAGLIVSGIWIAYAKTNTNDRVARTVTIIDKTVQATREFLTARADIPTDIGRRMHEQGGMPSDLSVVTLGENDVVYNSPLGQGYQISPIKNVNNVFEIRLAFTPGSGQCTGLISSLLGNSRVITERGIVGYQFGSIGSGWSTTDITTFPNVLSPTQNQLISGCKEAVIANLYFASRP